MEITISKEELSKALYMTQSIVEKKTSMPILANIIISVTDDAVSFSASDLEISAITRPNAKITTAGKTSVNARIFNDIVRELPEGDIRLTLTEGERLEISSGKSTLRMIGVNPDEHPGLPGTNLLVAGSADSNTLLEMVSKTLYAVSTDETRFNLCGVCFTRPESAEKGELRMVATDGHRLAMITRNVGNFEVTSDVIVPRKGLQEMKKILSENPDTQVGLAIEDGFLILDAGTTRIAMRLIDGDFPDYKQVIPNETGERAVFGSEEISQALKRVALMVSDKGKCVKLDFSTDKLCISSSSPELGDAKEELEISYAGEPLSVGFNARYVVDIANSLNEKCAMSVELFGQLGPGKFFAENDDSYIGIVMPMRLM